MENSAIKKVIIAPFLERLRLFHIEVKVEVNTFYLQYLLVAYYGVVLMEKIYEYTKVTQSEQVDMWRCEVVSYQFIVIVYFTELAS